MVRPFEDGRKGAKWAMGAKISWAIRRLENSVACAGVDRASGGLGIQMMGAKARCDRVREERGDESAVTQQVTGGFFLFEERF
jgi:hypothetical protein